MAFRSEGLAAERQTRRQPPIANSLRHALSLILLSLLVVLSGCASLSKQISSLVSNGHYAEARKKLDEAGVGAVVASGATKDADRVLARQLFQERLEEQFSDEIDNLLKQGKARQAAARAAEAAQLCPWSDALKRWREERHAFVARIDALDSELVGVLAVLSAASADLTIERSLLTKAVPYRQMLADSPAVESRIRQLEVRVLGVWNDKLGDPAWTGWHESDRLRADLNLVGAPTDYQQEILAALTQIMLLADKRANAIKKESFRGDVLNTLRMSLRPGPAPIEGIRGTVRTRLASNLRAALHDEVQRFEIAYPVMAFAEELLALLPGKQSGFRQLVAQSHLIWAQKLAPTGRTAVLALIHLDRARTLGGALDASRLARMQSVAEASFAAAGPVPLTIRINTNPQIDPIFQDLVQLTVFNTILERSKPHIRWKLIGAEDSPGDVLISIDAIQLFLPGFDQLNSVTSSYLSHYEKVPNPYKDVLESQLNSQRFAVNMAESALTSAITSHNIYPTQWSLANVNNARTRYYMAVDHYNTLVQQYNLTPSTITRPVYLPYSFHQGTIRQGWSLSGSLTVTDRVEPFVLEEIETDFVRIGSRANDKEVSYRRSDSIDIPIGVERQLSQLDAVVSRLRQRLAAMMQSIALETRIELPRDEQVILGAALQPFGQGYVDLGGSTIPAWSHEALGRLELPKLAESKPPVVRLAKGPAKIAGGDPEHIFKSHSPAIAMIYAKGRSLSTGSGALISGDGLVLTAAHVLRSDRLEVEFPASGDGRRYPAEIVFTNDSNDVALIRARGYRSAVWLEIALNEGPRPGEPIVDIGNPGVMQGGVVKLSVSSGIVAKPPDGDGLKWLVADIAAASGSSGSPLISRRTGKIVGVVTAIAAPTLSEDFARSGYWVLAAPSTELARWLGLGYEQQ